MVDVTKLTPWVKNPRKNDPAVQRVAESIRQFGFASPIIARRENGEIIAGHTRVKAAKLLGLKQVPVRYLDLDEKQAHALALADNKLGELAEWDDALLGEVLGDFTIGEAVTAGFDPSDLGAFIGVGEDDDSGEERAGPVLGAKLKYQVLVECQDEDHQTALLERLEEEGLKCKPLVS